MTLAPLKFLQSGPPAPAVVLLPDSKFFIRSVPIAVGAAPAEVAGQIELALETLAPFPPGQLYYGYYWVTGAERALVFAAYRRRFTTDQVAEWEKAELVAPTFSTALGGTFRPGSTLVVPSADGLTGIYWETSPVPARVVFRSLAAEATEEERTKVLQELRDAVPANRATVLATGPVAEAGARDHEFNFRSEGFVSELPAAVSVALDVRDKDSLAALRRARARDVILWRVFLGCAAAIALLALGELALLGLGLATKSRTRLIEAQRARVESIATAQSLAIRINELSTKRLLPLEMLAKVSDKRPDGLYFSKTSTSGLYGLTIEAYTSSPATVSTFQSALVGQPDFESVEIRDQRTRDNVMNFTVVVSFKPGAVKPAAP